MVCPALGMRVGIIIPVGPGHEHVAEEAVDSVERAWKMTPGPFTDHLVVRVPDPEGHLGRSAARNWGMDAFRDLDWHFLLDADDRMMPEAFMHVRRDSPATFGAVFLRGKVSPHNRYPVSRSDLFVHGAKGTLSMGCFVRGDLGLRFNETLDVGEDFDFYMRLPGFTKVKQPLVDIGWRVPSAGGPRGYQSDVPWLERCGLVIDGYKALERT